MSEHVTARTTRSALLLQVMKFGAVGGVGFVVNLVVFNALRATVFNPSVQHFGPLYATVVATVVAIAVNWIGNRYWAFSSGRQSNTAREGAEFFAVSLIGMLIPLACVWVSHYLMGLTSPLADNISNNVIGLGLGTLFRFALYRWWVFSPNRPRVLRTLQAAEIVETDATIAAVVLSPHRAEDALPTADDPGVV
jgi:putative flippase GtrA